MPRSTPSPDRSPTAPQGATVPAMALALCLGTSVQAGSFRPVGDFSPNPARLQGLVYVPSQLSAGAPLVMALHGCLQRAREYGQDTGWIQLAETLGFAVLLPEQNLINNPSRCFNWFKAADTRRDQGEAASLMGMLDATQTHLGLDKQRAFVTGLSAGGAMAAVLLAVYGDRFAGGAILAGVPYRCTYWSNAGAAWTCMTYGNWFVTSPAAWGARVREATPYRGPWPRLSIWHGSGDSVVSPVNGEALVAQWSDLHGIDQIPDATSHIGTDTTLTYQNAAGQALIEYHRVEGLGHGVPVDAKRGCGADRSLPEDYMYDLGLCASRQIAAFWGLMP